MARTYLQLVHRLKQECAIPGARPTTLAGLTPEGEAQRLADWIADAWIDILTLHPDWRFRRRSVTFATSSTSSPQGIYTPSQCGLTSTLGRWMLSSFRAYRTAAGVSSEYELTETDYDCWRDTYLMGANRSVYSQPCEIAEHPESTGLALGPLPETGYTITGDYYLAPNRMSVDADLPGLPAQYDDLGIVWKAMIEYGGYEADSAAYQRAVRNYSQFINRLEREQLPTPSLCVSLEC